MSVVVDEQLSNLKAGMDSMHGEERFNVEVVFGQSIGVTRQNYHQWGPIFND
jgi:hypothetical protein